MKTSLTILLSLFWAITILGQKVRLEGDNSLYLCLNDSIAETFEMELKKSKVDNIITIVYDYDNGRLPDLKRIIIWTHNGRSEIKIVEGCDKITTDTTHVFNMPRLWEYIWVTHFDDVTVPIKSGTGQSHDKFYHIRVSTPHKSFFIVVRNNERQRTTKYKTPESDTRVMLTNKIHSLLIEALQPTVHWQYAARRICHELQIASQVLYQP